MINTNWKINNVGNVVLNSTVVVSLLVLLCNKVHLHILVIDYRVKEL